ncbi:hypothetical protein EJB05_18768 [Eragrostis curvula]|uniref:RING-type domain-containing protein n=1 Tax=Eragrostis curvula TaxID=38414 RepID=A0A5J9VKP7_9POAL|nr:hypothetical protein EJB05_18768 [Eragrostis curvula]
MLWYCCNGLCDSVRCCWLFIAIDAGGSLVLAFLTIFLYMITCCSNLNEFNPFIACSVTCILRWASYKQTPLCPQCKHPFEFLSVHRSLDGCIHDYLFEESVCLLLRAAWFEPLLVEAHEEALEEEDFYHQYQYDDDEDDLDEESYYMSRSPSIRIGNRRWGDNGYIRGGRREARPRPAQNESADGGPSRTPKNKEAAASGSGSVPSRTPKKKEASASGSGSVSKDVAGRRAKRAQKREAADRAAAEKHLKHLQRLGLSKTPEVPAALEVGPQVNE